MALRLSRNQLLIVLALALIVAAVAWVWLGDPADRAPDSRFTTLDGNTVELADLRNRPTLVYFWATDCVTCMREMPDLVELYRDLQPEGFELIAVALPHDNRDDLIAVRDERGLPFPIVFDEAGTHGREFGNVRVTPTKFLIGPDGRIRMRHIGSSDPTALRDRIERLL